MFGRSKFAWILCASYITSWRIAVADTEWTPKHEEGRCAIRGNCGKESIFSGELPCLDNGLAKKPDKQLRTKLVDICGEDWSSGSVCCDEDQVDALVENLHRVDIFISTCPACQHNFYNLFCTFTCSPDQSLFVNVTNTIEKNNKTLVTELDNLWCDRYTSEFYKSCKDVKFGPSNSRAIDWMGGKAKNSSEFLAFLGEKKALGSPFQMNFPRPSNKSFDDFVPADPKSYPCSTNNSAYKCSCVDCADSCPELDEIPMEEGCHVGAWPCLSFAVVVVYAGCLALLITAIVGHITYRKRRRRRDERLRLLQDTAMSDDESEDGDISYQQGALNRSNRRYMLNTVCDSAFARLGHACATFPAITIGTTLLVALLLSLGWLRFAVERDPVRLWVAPDSAAAQEKAFFDEQFGPFFRSEQVFLVNDSTTPAGPGPVLSYDTLRWWFDVESRVDRLRSLEHGVTFADVCYNPINQGCVVQSVSGYWQGDASQLDPSSWDDQLRKCVKNPNQPVCLAAAGLPIDEKLVLGGVFASPLDAEALVTTWVVQNAEQGSEHELRAIEWESSLKNLLLSIQNEAKERGFRLSFNTEISLEQELNKSTNTDAKIVLISYVIMFLYASLALGSTTLVVGQVLKTPSMALVQSKFSLGVVGIVIVLLSVSASVGLFSAFGVKVTLIIAEVIPFLVLAVGVDNIFLIVHEFERVNTVYAQDPISQRMARALGRMGPSILLSATVETVSFALGAFVDMPAVRNFAIYAAGAVVINALLQVTMFVSFLALNQQRVEAGRADCIPCIQIVQPIRLQDESSKHSDFLQTFIKRTYAPALLGKKMKVFITSIFLGMFTIGLALLPEIQPGLDQRIAIPDGSYLINYFNDLDSYFRAGPPVYFVTRELNITQREHQKQLCGRFSSCGEYSLANILEQESKRSNASFIADATASWVDDYFIWLNACCEDPDTHEPCMAGRWNGTMDSLPAGQEYLQYLSQFLDKLPDADCPIAGKGVYSSAVNLPSLDEDGLYDPVTIPASHFRTSHTPLRSQADFIEAYASARRICSSIEDHNPGVSVFPYSKFYIFFDQYATITSLTLSLLACAIIACFLLSSLLLGSIRTGLAIALTVTMVLVDIGGAMAISGVSLNAVTLVNLVISVGIAVEFCAHIARAFQFPSTRLLESRLTPDLRTGSYANPAFSMGNEHISNSGAGLVSPSSLSFSSRDARAWASLSQVGSSVFSGITVTKLLGVCVLAFTRSKIFEIYYFRVWLVLVILGALHALVWFPVLLSWIGGQGYVDPEADGSLEEDLTRRRIRGLFPDDDDDEDDDEH